MSLRHKLAIQASLAAEPTVAESIERAVSPMPLTDTLRLIARLVNHEKFGDCDAVYCEQLDSAIAALLERAEGETAVDWREAASDRRWFEKITA